MAGRNVFRRAALAVACTVLVSSAVTLLLGVASADPVGGNASEPPAPGLTQAPYADPMRNNDAPPPPLPVVVPTATTWQPKIPFPFDQYRDRVTAADITAMGEMCQWYTAQYDELIGQIDRFNVDLIAADGQWETTGITEQADAVVANLDRSLEYLGPRAQALTISHDYAGDLFFPVYQGESFYRLWQQLSNVRDGLRGRQPAWFTGPSLQHAMRFGSKIHRSHVCD